MTRARVFVSALLVLAASACGRGCGEGVAADAGADGALAHDWEIPDGKVPFEKPKLPVPDALRGTWHLANGRGAIDLELHEDSMLVWRYNDCVCVGGACARWSEAHGTIDVRADYGWRLYWPLVPDKNIPRSVELRAARLEVKDGALHAALTPLGDAGPFEQVWERGGVCPKCRSAIPGPLPDGPPVPCAPEFMFCPLSNSGDYVCH